MRSHTLSNSAFSVNHGFLSMAGDLDLSPAGDLDRVLSALPGDGMELPADVGHASTHISAAVALVAPIVAPGLFSVHNDRHCSYVPIKQLFPWNRCGNGCGDGTEDGRSCDGTRVSRHERAKEQSPSAMKSTFPPRSSTSPTSRDGEMRESTKLLITDLMPPALVNRDNLTSAGSS